jgi:hypothetical protein
MGKRIAVRRARVWPWFMLAALLHGAFDTFLSFGILSPLSFLLEGGMALTFVMLLRRALRYGPAIPASATATATEEGEGEGERIIFTVGSVERFVFSSVGFVFSMLPLAGLAAFLEAIHPHAANAWPWIMVGSVLVFFSGLMAYAVSATMPLDVVLDASGVTFAGSRRAWSTVRGISTIRTKRRYLQLASSDGDLYIGPMDPLTMARVEHAVISHAAGQM